jgi:hypothetical protein
VYVITPTYNTEGDMKDTVEWSATREFQFQELQEQNRLLEKQLELAVERILDLEERIRCGLWKGYGMEGGEGPLPSAW